MAGATKPAVCFPSLLILIFATYERSGRRGPKHPPPQQHAGRLQLKRGALTRSEARLHLVVCLRGFVDSCQFCNAAAEFNRLLHSWQSSTSERRGMRIERMVQGLLHKLYRVRPRATVTRSSVLDSLGL